MSAPSFSAEDPTKPAHAVVSRNGWFWASVLTLAVACAYVFLWAMDQSLNHDEHQFLAPGALLSREGLLPYRDYPLFHLPNLVFIYGGLDWLTGQLLLSAKMVSVVATCAVAVLLWLVIGRRTVEASGRWRWFLASAVLLLFLADPLTFTSTGQTWNHELPSFLTVAALLLLCRGASRDSLWCSAASGILLGVAIGTRLTFAPLGIPFAVFPLLLSFSWRRRLAHSAVFCLAGIVASAPSLYFFCVDREEFLFGNLEFPRLRLLDPGNERIRKTMTWWRKLRYFAKEIVLPSWPLFLAFFLVGVRPALAWFRHRSAKGLASALLLMVLPFAMLGCFTPSRYQYQHYYLFAPLLSLGVALGVTAHRDALAGVLRRQRAVMMLAVISLALVIGNALREEGLSAFDWLRRIAQPHDWYPAKVREIGQAIHTEVPEGKVLTLAPLVVLEGGLRIYPEFATGPFAWRSGEYVEEARRAHLKVIAPADLEALLRRDPPAAILTGVEDERLEKPLVAYAETHGFRPKKLEKRRLLWLPPMPAALSDPPR